jgi:CRISPR-associated protein Csx10
MNAETMPTYLHYRLTLRSPALVSTLSGDPNSAATQPFIPGASIRGAVAARLNPGGVSGTSDDFRCLILSGTVRYLHAYLEMSGSRPLPAPSAWQSKKDDLYSAIDLAAFSGDIAPDDDEPRWPQDPLSPVPGAFIAASSAAGTREIGTPAIIARLHQQRDRVKGRPWTDQDEQPHGIIFAYEYLQADQVFCGVIQVLSQASNEIARIKALIGGMPILVGRSRRAGYGGEAEIEFKPDTHLEYEDVSGSISGDIAAGERFRMMLTSAYVGRHCDTGQIDPSALDQELCSKFNGAASVECRRLAFETVGGFNQKWRLELPQALAVAAGGVLVLKAREPIAEKTLRQIEHDGLGERRAEGLGRALFLQHTDFEEAESNGAIQLRELKEQAGRQRGEPTASLPLSEAERAQVEILERRIVLAAARAELDRIATIDIASKARTRPTTSLLGRLRTLFRSVVNEKTGRAALTNLGVWCDSNNENALKDRARKQLEGCMLLRDCGLMTWLTRLAAIRTGEQSWQALKQAVGNSANGLNRLPQIHHLTDPRKAEAQLHAHAAQLSVHLIDGVLAALSRLNRRGG